MANRRHNTVIRCEKYLLAKPGTISVRWVTHAVSLFRDRSRSARYGLIVAGFRKLENVRKG